MEPPPHCHPVDGQVLFTTPELSHHTI
jgi:hypothetical protein